ncbi:MAG: hydrogenase nickel incorporation protein HypA/HybF [Candidatus Binatota bacterium]|jgi:hydrogenase nickel incorporation protein HypA/HybF|nr:hydrogenase nickel incorporation protein HypA/HybF [Candidatus Binatota bacterium]
MHEVGITQEIVAIASERAGTAKVSRVVVEIGRLTAVLPDAVRFCFDLVAEGTPLEGAVLDIVEIEGRGRCLACLSEMILEQPFGRCTCGATEFEWLAGEELRIREMEVR